MNKPYNLSLVFPVLNERKNLEILIPEFYEFLNENVDKFEILVIDDNSTDGTDKYISDLEYSYENLVYVKRDSENSLPLSILEGINKAEYKNVAWLDADGSMHIDAFSKLIHSHRKSPSSVVIGSRFVNGGGYKGMENLENRTMMKSIFNVQKSNDSVVGMILSNLFNKLLSIFYKSDVKDITSGFIIAPKNQIVKSSFENCTYGEYFIYLIANFIEQNIKIIEVGYICETRLHGVSKTAPSLKVLINRGIPYILAAIKCRRKIGKN